MNESQVKQFEEIVQQIAKSSGIDADAAVTIAIGVLKLHAIESIPEGEHASGGPVSSLG